MAARDGECIKERFYIAIDPQRKGTFPDLPTPIRKGCCGECVYKPLADAIGDGTDELKNDISIVDWFFDNITSGAVMTLQKWDHTISDYVDAAALNDNTYGMYYELGTYFTNSKGEKYVGYTIEWRKVLIAFGEGTYRVSIAVDSIISGNFTLLTGEYCMHQYTPILANRTIRIDYYINGIIGDNDNDLNKRDYGTINRYNTLRFRGWFSYSKSTYTDEYTQYNNGERPWIKSEQEPEWDMTILPICWDFHQLMRTDVLMADKILVTDYNSENFATWAKKSVQKTSEYAPNFFVLQNKRASVTTLKFRQSANNLKKRRL